MGALARFQSWHGLASERHEWREDGDPWPLWLRSLLRKVRGLVGEMQLRCRVLLLWVSVSLPRGCKEDSSVCLCGCTMEQWELRHDGRSPCASLSVGTAASVTASPGMGPLQPWAARVGRGSLGAW